MDTCKGRIHSIDTFSTVDGPGTRFVVFFQGCPLRCLYCHNPDSWSVTGGEEVTVEEILHKLERNRHFYQQGGLTATGGEPLLQMEFLTALFKSCKDRDIHTTLDTSGITFTDEKKDLFEELIRYTDLVLLDIKDIREDEHFHLTGSSNKNVLSFAKWLDGTGVPYWIRHVVIPTLNDQEESLYQLGTFIGKLKNVKAVEVLPYHTMAKGKYANMNMDYPLAHISDLSPKEAMQAKIIIMKAIKDQRSLPILSQEKK